MVDDLRHFHLNGWERLQKWLSEAGESVSRWMGAPAMAGFTRGQVLLIAVIAAMIALDLGEQFFRTPV